MVIQARNTQGRGKPAAPRRSRPEFKTLSDGSLDLAYFAGELLPNPDAIIVSLGGDLRNYAKLSRDDQVCSLMQQRQDALIAAEWEVVPGGEEARDEEAADFLREQLSALSWDSVTRKMHKGVMYGYSVAECIWGRDGGRITLDGIRVRKPWRFGFGKNGGLKLRVLSGVLPMPERKFWVATWGADDDDSLYGTGLGYHLWWPCYLKRNGAKFWSAFLDKFGTPSTKATYPNGATEEEKETALRAARALRSESAVAMPEGFEIQILEASGKGTASYEEFLKYWDDAIAKIILGQTGTTRQGQYAGTGDVLEGVKAEMIKADADLLCESFNCGPAVWLTEWNFPGAKAPQVWRRVVNARRTKAEAERDRATYELGLELSDEEISRRYGDAWQRRAGASFTSTVSNAGTSAGSPGASFAEREEEDEPGELAGQLAEVADPHVSGMVEAIRRELDDVLAGGGSFAEFSARLSNLYPVLDTAELTEALEGAFLAANLAGENMPKEAEFKGTPFQEAIDFFQGKVRVPTRMYTDLMNRAHSKAFMVAGAMRDDLLCDLQEAIGRAFTAGDTLEDFRKDFDNIVAKYGWKYRGGRNWRTRVIYDTNVRTAYSAGHWQQMQAAKRMRPYGRYLHGPSLHPREQHLAWDGKVVPLDDPWWDYRWPPNGWGCKCSVTSVSERELERNGWTVEHPEADETIKVTVNTPDGPMEVETVEGVDPSFAYNPGKSATGIRLSPRMMEEAKADGTWKLWRPVPWGAGSMETWQSLGRPEKPPVDTMRAKLAEKVDSPEALRPILEKMIGGQEDFFLTADGAPVLLSVDTLMHIQPRRSTFVPLIPELLSDPFEVWMDFEEHEATGRVELKKRYLKRVDTGERETGILMVVQVVKGQLAGWTFIPAERGNYLNNIRRGKLVWAREG